MVSLEQIRALEARVEKAVGLIDKLRKENAELDQKLVESSRAEEQAKAAFSQLESTISSLERRALDAEAETALYKEKALAAERRAVELEAKADEFRREQSRIEEGLASALTKLDAFEDFVMGIKTEAKEPGDEKVEAIEESPSIPEPQTDPFPGAGNELDIF